MTIIEQQTVLQEALAEARHESKHIALVPTMGALHEGHASLVRRAVEENEVVVVSLFVNPTQFNDPSDLCNYPRTPEADYALLDSLGVNYVFAPTVEEMYPEPDTRVFCFAPLDRVMEGVQRPGHFNGVAQIVSKLFYIVQPDRAYFGEKDFQQLAIIRCMTQQLGLPIEIVGCPIYREASGLAMSSRNQLLKDREREQAAQISQVLFKSREMRENSQLSPLQLQQYVEQAIDKAEGLTLEYFSICDADTLQPISEWQAAAKAIGCITVRVGSVRLIDNITY